MENVIDNIKKLKEEKNALIVAHYYQLDEVQEIADYIGDSYYLSKVSAESDKDIIVFCGVQFMAESAKILSPDKKVLLPNLSATCSMVDMVNKENVLKLKEKHPKAKVLCYINSTTDVKTVSDVCCTSSSAVDIVKNVDSDEIIFIPDQNLGSYIGEQFTEKEMILVDGYCCIHHNIKASDVLNAKAKYSDNLKVLVHPECRKEVRDLADFVGSTGQIVSYVSKDSSNEYLVVTDVGIGYILEKNNPDKKFHYLDMVCSHMKITRLEHIYDCLKNERNEIVLDKDIIEKAYNSLKMMHVLSR